MRLHIYKSDVSISVFQLSCSCSRYIEFHPIMGFILLNKIWFGCKCLSAKRFYNFIFCTHDSLFCHQFNANFCVSLPPPPKCSPSFVAHQKALGFGIVVPLIRFSYMYCGWIWLDSFRLKSKMPARKIQSVTHKFTDAYKFHSTAVANQILPKSTTESNPIWSDSFKWFLWMFA